MNKSETQNTPTKPKPDNRMCLKKHWDMFQLVWSIKSHLVGTDQAKYILNIGFNIGCALKLHMCHETVKCALTTHDGCRRRQTWG